MTRRSASGHCAWARGNARRRQRHDRHRRGKDLPHRAVELGRGLLHQLPARVGENVDQELGWTREEFKKIGVKFAFLRSTRENDWYPHYIHNLDNLVRFGGLFPPIHVHADIRRTKLLGSTQVFEGGCMMVRAGEAIFRIRT